MAKEVLARVQRSPEDAKELRPLEKKEEKGEEKEEKEKEPHGANSVIESINGDLDNFLAMYEDESDEEEEAKPVDTAQAGAGGESGAGVRVCLVQERSEQGSLHVSVLDLPSGRQRSAAYASE